MVPLKTLVLLVLVVVIGLSALGPRAGAQEEDPSGRFAFADTTLLRDTLNLKFNGLFRIADSLQITPQALRTLSIRHRIPLLRLVHLSDSLRMPVDSVGVIMERERFNPLAARVERQNAFAYNSGYSIDRRSTTWSNDTDYNFVYGALFLRNVTSIAVTRTSEGGVIDLHKDRSMNTEFGWRFSRKLSIGGRVNLQGTDNFKPGSIYNNSQTTNQYDFSIRTRQEPTRNLNSEISLFGGPFDEPNSVPIKRGLGSVLSGRLSYHRGQWLTQDLSAQVNGRFGRARLPERPWLDTRDLTTDVRGGAGLFENRRVRLHLNYRYRKSTFQRPDTVTTLSDGDTIGVIQDLVRKTPSSSRSVDLGVRLQQSGDRYLNFSGSLGDGLSILAVTRDGVFTQDRSTTQNRGLGLDGRSTVRGWSLEGRFSLAEPISDQPRRALVSGASVYYRERQRTQSRSVEAKASRNLTPRVTVNATGSVSLNSTFLSSRGSTNHTLDDYRQSYRIEGQMGLSQKASTRLQLEVSRILSINLLAASSASNREERSYRAGWQWTYRLLPNLTVNQFNQLSANYLYYSFVPANNRLTLDYANVTTLNAVITPRLTVVLTHNARTQPSGGYTRAEDRLDYFSPSDEARDYNLSGSISYQPVGGLSLRLAPTYSASDRTGTVDGGEVPVSRRRSLNFTGGASLDLPVARKGRLTGNIGRTFASSASTRFQNGVPQAEPSFSDDFWNGSLQFSWTP